MDSASVVKTFLKLPDLKDGSKWQASHRIDDVPTSQRPKVKEFGCGLQDGEAWFRFKLNEDGQDKDLRGTYSFKNINERITIDGKDVDADDVVISNRFAGLNLRGVIEYEFELEEKTHRYRFDATLYSPV
jgi:hypothetical protein